MLQTAQDQTNLHPQVNLALAILEEAAAATQTSTREFELARQAAATLTRWQIDTASVVAAVLARLFQTTQYDRMQLEKDFGAETVTLATAFASWREEDGINLERGIDLGAKRLSQSLRRLLRLAYLKSAGLPLIFLALADHHAQLIHPEATEQNARVCRAVFVPLAEMLGLWSIRREWLTTYFRLQAPERSARLEDQLTNRIESDKTEAYARFSSDLLEAVQSLRLHVTPRLARSPETTGSLLQGEEVGETQDDLPVRLTVHIFCQSIDDCYRVLGAVHGLGRPVTTRYSERFDDYISSPKPNGYRALHTSLMYEFVRGSSRKGVMLMKVRILTPTMYRLNEWGALAGFSHRSRIPLDADSTWWKPLSWGGVSPEDTSEAGQFAAVRGLISAYDLGAFATSRVYVFTPAGQARIMQEGSTALDFAYHVHTEVGHHAARIEVNGLVVSYAHVLQNGDLVSVRYDPSFSGPDLSWLRFVHTDLGRSRVRAGLLRRAKQISIARLAVERALIRLIDYYHDQRHYTIEITTGRLEAFLFRVVRLRSLPDIAALYDALTAAKISADKLVRNLIAEEMAAALVNPTGDPVKYPLHRITVCDECRPIPGDPILVLERRAGTSAKGLVVHRKECQAAAKSNKVIVSSLTWSRSEGPQNLLVEYEIAANNRYHLLGDILDLIYIEPNVHLYKVEAQAYNERPARVVLTLEAVGPEQISRLHSQFELVKGVEQVFSYPIAHGAKALFTSSTITIGINPYDESAVFLQYSFYDREEQAAHASRWLTEPIPAPVLILHGQRRVGKSALAKFLIQEVATRKRLATSVYIDLQGLSSFGAAGFARYLAGLVYSEALKSAPPPQEPWEEPMLWLNRVLRNAAEQLGNTRLLVVLDEFNYLLDLEQDGQVDPVLFPNLRAVIGERRDVHWLLIVQDVRFRDPASWGGAGPLLQQSVPLHVPNLDSHWARKLILEPAGQAGFTYDGQSDADRARDVAAVAFDYTAGNPYLIQALCRNMIDQASRHKRRNVTMSDLKFALHLVLSEGNRYFDHFLRYLNETKYRAIVSTVVHSSQPLGDWAQRDRVAKTLRRKLHLTPVELDAAITRLARVGILEESSAAGHSELRIAVPIFHEWASMYLA